MRLHAGRRRGSVHLARLADGRRPAGRRRARRRDGRGPRRVLGRRAVRKADGRRSASRWRRSPSPHPTPSAGALPRHHRRRGQRARRRSSRRRRRRGRPELQVVPEARPTPRQGRAGRDQRRQGGRVDPEGDAVVAGGSGSSPASTRCRWSSRRPPSTTSAAAPASSCSTRPHCRARGGGPRTRPGPPRAAGAPRGRTRDQRPDPAAGQADSGVDRRRSAPTRRSWPARPWRSR